MPLDRFDEALLISVPEEGLDKMHKRAGRAKINR